MNESELGSLLESTSFMAIENPQRFTRLGRNLSEYVNTNLYLKGKEKIFCKRILKKERIFKTNYFFVVYENKKKGFDNLRMYNIEEKQISKAMRGKIKPISLENEEIAFNCDELISFLKKELGYEKKEKEEHFFKKIEY